MSGKGSLAKIGVGILSDFPAATATAAARPSAAALRIRQLRRRPGTRNITINYGGALAVAGLQTTVTNWLNTNNIVASSSGAWP